MAKSVKELFHVGTLSTKLLFSNFSYVLFVVFLAFIYIANHHYAIRKVRQIHVLQNEVQELRREYNARKADVMHATTFSEVEAKVDAIELQPSGQNPKQIIIND